MEDPLILCLILDLSNSYLKLKCKITKSNGTNIVAADEVTVINYPIASLFSHHTAMHFPAYLRDLT